MCGVFGFVSEDGGRDGRVNLEVLRRIALVTERRGPHAFGFAWIDRRGRLKMYKQRGRIGQHLNLLSMAADARMLIGHCRFATQGSPDDNINNHPHPADGGWIVHNGQLPDYEGLVGEHDLYPVSACDSEVLGLLIEEGKGNVLERCRTAVRVASPEPEPEPEPDSLFSGPQPLVLLGLWPRPDRLVAIRRGNPLHLGRVSAEGCYLASLADGLPGQVHLIQDGTACLFTRSREVHHAEV
jgi:glucosamine 6-phosphate synthetase-like amidotransferase/phosphosugar isomerase protein